MVFVVVPEVVALVDSVPVVVVVSDCVSSSEVDESSSSSSSLGLRRDFPCLLSPVADVPVVVVVPDVDAVVVEVVSVVESSSSSVESLPLELSLPDLLSLRGVGINDTRRFIELALGLVAEVEVVGVVLVFEVVLRDVVVVVVPVADVDPDVREREVVVSESDPEEEDDEESEEELDDDEELSSEEDESDSDEEGSSRRLRRAGGILCVLKWGVFSI